MHSLAPEIEELARQKVIDEATAARALALARGTVFPVFEELRVGMYLGVALATTGLGILIKNNLDRIGPVTIMAVIAGVAALCYASAIRAHVRGASRSLGGDYILLLGALLVSIDLGYAESQFHWLGADWSRHLLILAIFHAVTAYWLDSRLVLSVALTAFVSWLGVERRFGNVFELDNVAPAAGWRAVSAAGWIAIWAGLNSRFSSRASFTPVLEQFAWNLAFWGALSWCFGYHMRGPGFLLLTALGAGAIIRGLRSHTEIFVIYGVCYTALGYCVLSTAVLHGALDVMYTILIIIVAATVGLFQLHGRLKDKTA